MILVIIGHTINYQALRGAIFSFHMPLFFICAGYTFHHSKDIFEFRIKTIKSFEQLVLIGAGLFILRLLVSKFILGENISLVEIPNALLYFTGSPAPSQPRMLIVGMVWFLVVLFETRVLFDGLLFLKSSVLRGILIVIITALGVIVGGGGYWLPLSLDIGFSCLIFLFVGTTINKIRLMERNTVCNILMTFAVWFTLLLLEYHYFNNYLELACRRYMFPPLSLACAVAGSVFILAVSSWLSQQSISRLLAFLGRNSLVLFAIHYMDRTWRIWALLPDTIFGQIAAVITRITIDIALLYCFYRLRFHIGQLKTKY